MKSPPSKNIKSRILIELSIPEPEKPCPPKTSLEEKVKSMLELIESGHESIIEWRCINRLYKDLCHSKYKNNKRVANLKRMIEPVLAKHGFHKVPQNDH